MKSFSFSISNPVLIFLWFTGIIVVQGFGWTLLAIFPPAGIYFGVEAFLKFFGVI